MHHSPERWLGICAGVIAGAGVLWYQYGPRVQRHLEDLAAPAPETAAAPPAPPEAAPAEAEFSAAETRAPPAPKAVDLAEADSGVLAAEPAARPPSGEPDLASYDDALHAGLAAVFGSEIVEDFLIEDRIAQAIVTTVDSLDQGAIAVRYRAIGAVPELPVVVSEDDSLWLDPGNSSRYDLLVSAVAAADMRRVAEVYRRFQPRFERAWRELGLGGSFERRLDEVIAHLIAAPSIEGPVELVRPKVLYRFADPELESLSSGHKLMIRLGPSHAATIRDKLRELRAALNPEGGPKREPAAAAGG